MALWGKTDTVGDVPLYLSDEEKKNVFFVDLTEAAVATNRAKGIKTPGWYIYRTYKDSSNTARHRAELLVPMKVSAANAGDVGAIVIAATSIVPDLEYTIVDPGEFDFTTIGATDSEAGTLFTANATPVGTEAAAATVTPTDDTVIADSIED